jgi:nucleoside 2-deoxyribosyltransferase
MTESTIYWAAPLFTQAEWLWNKLMAAKLQSLGLRVILPQDRSRRMFKKLEPFSPKLLFDLSRMTIQDGHADYVVAILDQADADSGTAFECGLAFDRIPVIGVRTDFRTTGDDPLLSMNIMMSQSCKAFILMPPDEFDNPDWLVNAIVSTILSINVKEQSRGRIETD